MRAKSGNDRIYSNDNNNNVFSKLLEESVRGESPKIKENTSVFGADATRATACTRVHASRNFDRGARVVARPVESRSADSKYNAPV